jgi:1-hydroxy-2-methyl-2-(E)-butenyl 4-diphosphate synthase
MTLTDPLRYCPDLLHYSRRATREVVVGNVGIGGGNPVRVQSMITSDTRDTPACVAEVLALADAGCEIVRITAQTRVYAANLENIAREVRATGCKVPLVADIHFKPDAALEAAKWVEKIRVNPGNYADKKKFEIREYSDAQYAEELDRIRTEFTPLVMLCKDLGRAMRIGTNHGSLSDRIMNRYGDSPLGMCESALEFARIARENDYHNFVFSMKASNPKVMIEAYRLLVARLNAEGPDWNYPIHLGVTEAGDGEDGRIKSAIGIGSLLADGIGDTIRVSLTEDAIHEIPVAQALAKPYNRGSDISPHSVGGASSLDISPHSVGEASGSDISPQPVGGASGSDISPQAIGEARGWGISPQAVGGARGWGVSPQAVGGASRPTPPDLQSDAQNIRPNWDQLTKHTSTYLPHWRIPGATYSVTFRLKDSLPPRLQLGYQQQKEALMHRLQEIESQGSRSAAEALNAIRGQITDFHETSLEDALNQGEGACHLKNPEIASLVEGALQHFDGSRYELLAWSVMPNHVHAVIRPTEGQNLEKILHAWKSFTAKKANELLGLNGAFWQEEYYDHLVRDGEDFRHQVKYVLLNPVKGNASGEWTGSKYGASWEEVLGARCSSNDLGRDAPATLNAPATLSPSYDPFSYERRRSSPITVMSHELGGDRTVRVFTTQERWNALAHKISGMGDYQPEIILEKSGIVEIEPRDDAAVDALNAAAEIKLVTVADRLDLEVIPAFRRLAFRLDPRHPILLKDTLHPPQGGTDFLQALLPAAQNIGSLLCDGIGDAVLVRGETAPGQSLRLAYNILQAAGSRIFKTDYVACPSCGRTLFNLQHTTQKIRAATGHLKGVRIAVMGCIVNGPGEMADADFGYVGGAPNKINLYVGKTAVKFNIPEDEAVERLIDLIREHGKWIEAPAPAASTV